HYYCIEIGAGLGTLSYYLGNVKRKSCIHYEVDEHLCKVAVELLNPNSVLIRGDALLYDWDVEEIVSNAPYHITSDIIVKTAKSNSIKKAVFVFQKDVVDRLNAKPRTKEYGRITILVQLLFNIEPGPVYPPSYFYPRPEVSSQLVVFTRKRPYDELISKLEEVTKKLFSKRRKKALKVIKKDLGLGEDELRKLGISEDKRVYELTPGELLRIAEML
ncbi:MAG: ribosomal RNA small subunit methyltransferase A, partial [Staphylothermus sp.]|nr:ribosomal RNA small subunit methyltransferase A [Staphylothermus sp.]